MTKTFRGAVVALMLGTAMACEDGDLKGPSGRLGSIIATINGSSWTSNQGVQGVFTNGILAIGGTGNAGSTRYALTLTISGVTAPGTYPLGPQFAGSFGTVNSTTVPTVTWSSAEAGGTGTVTITSLAGDRILGTFSFTGISTTETGANATRTVTNGSFDLKF